MHLRARWFGTPWPGIFLAGIALVTIAALSPASTRQVLLNSARLALGAAAIALPIGTLLAVLFTRCPLPGRRLAAVLLGMLLFLPLYVQVGGWDAAVGKLGWQTLMFGSGANPWLAGMPAAIFLHAVAAIPWVALIVGLGLMQTDSRQEEAALLEASPLAVLLAITLPQCRGFLLAAGLWVVVATASDMTVTNIYLIDPSEMTFTEQFYMNFSIASDARQAVLAVLPGLGSLLVLVLLALWGLATLARRRMLAGRTQRMVMPTGPLHYPLAALFWGMVLALVGVPLASLATKAGFVVEQVGGVRRRSWSAAQAWEMVWQVPTRYGDELRWTVVIATAAATLAISVALVLALMARRGRWPAIPAVIATAVALVLPGPVVGIGLIYLLNQNWSPTLIWLYEKTVTAPVLAQAVRALPLAIVLCWHSLATLSDDELSAAALEGSGRGRTLWLIALPQRWAALAGAWLAALAVAAGDLAWSHLVVPAGAGTIQQRVFGLVHYGAEEQVAGICLVVAAAYAALAVPIVWIVTRSRRGAPHL